MSNKAVRSPAVKDLERIFLKRVIRIFSLGPPTNSLLSQDERDCLGFRDVVARWHACGVAPRLFSIPIPIPTPTPILLALRPPFKLQPSVFSLQPSAPALHRLPCFSPVFGIFSQSFSCRTVYISASRGPLGPEPYRGDPTNQTPIKHYRKPWNCSFLPKPGWPWSP